MRLDLCEDDETVAWYTEERITRCWLGVRALVNAGLQGDDAADAVVDDDVAGEPVAAWTLLSREMERAVLEGWPTCTHYLADAIHLLEVLPEDELCRLFARVARIAVSKAAQLSPGPEHEVYARNLGRAANALARCAGQTVPTLTLDGGAPAVDAALITDAALREAFVAGTQA